MLDTYTMTTLSHITQDPTDHLLFEHFATLATAPEGIARLRELILQLAVQGKLGTQDTGDEPASVLAKKIRKEKERLSISRKIRNEKSLDSITETMIPYQIPKNWTWMRFGELGQVVGGGTPRTTNSEYYVSHGIPWLTPADLYRHKGKYIGRGKKDISEDGLKESSAQLLPKGAILFSIRAPIGYVAIASNSLSTNQGFKSCIPYIIEMSEYIYFFLVSSAKEIDARASGTTFKEVSGQEVKRILFPLPPLVEQHRIVAKVDRLMAICDELEARQQKERAGCLRLGTASLTGLQNAESPEEFGRQWAQVCDAFDLILDCPENVAVLRQTILQLAVQGRLVRQEPGDELAKKLVDRIRKEKEQLVKDGKIGKTKLTPEIESEEIPYPIPKNWFWTRLDHITYISTGSTPSTSTKEYYIGGNIPWVTSSLTSQKLICNVDTKITEKAVEDCSLKTYPEGTLLVALYGQGKTRGQVSELGIPATINQACSAIVFWKNNEPVKDYLKLVLTGNYEKIRSISAGGAQPNLNGDKIKRMLIPLPRSRSNIALLRRLMR